VIEDRFQAASLQADGASRTYLLENNKEVIVSSKVEVPVKIPNLDRKIGEIQTTSYFPILSCSSDSLIICPDVDMEDRVIFI
jgi:hypothetical protein